MRKRKPPSQAVQLRNLEGKDVLTRTLDGVCEFRSIDEQKRTATFTAATENGVLTWAGREHLRMTGARLQRYRKNPVVLDSHNRFEAGAVIGRANVRIEDKTLISEVLFAQTERAEEVWQLVKGGFLRAVSVGFIPSRARTVELQEGETDGEGESIVKGPARVIKEWELFEISVVPVPADAEAIRRQLEQEEPPVSKPETPVTPPAPAVQPRALSEDELKAERERKIAEDQTATREAANKQVLGLAAGDKDLEVVARGCILEGLTFDESRKRIKEAYDKQRAAVGTPEPAAPAKPAPKPGEAPKLAEVSDADLQRSLCGR